MRHLMLLLSITLAACSGTSAPPLSEQVVNNAAIFLGNQFAPILPMSDGSALIFRNEGGLHILHLWPNTPEKQTIETIDGFEIPYSVSGWWSAHNQTNYASVRTSAGIWLIGKTIELVSPDNTRKTGILNKPRNAPTAVALPDGSILVAGSEEWKAIRPNTYDSNAPDLRTVERVSLDSGGRIVSEYVSPVPSCRPLNCNLESMGSFAMIHIGQGRVMLAGGFGSPNAYIYDPTTRSWRKTMSMSEERRQFSLTLLLDGRVLAAGGNVSIRSHSNRGMTTEIWDPKTEQWSTGPKLPVPMLEHTAMLVNDKMVILAGGRFAGVLAWDIDKPQWRIAAQLANARARAGVVYLENDQLAIIGGLHANSYDEAWGRRTEGYSLVTIPHDATRFGKPAGLTAKGHAIAVRGPQTFVAGGMLTSSFDGSVDDQPTSNVELFDSSDNTVRSLPPLPFGTKSAKALWLDDHRVLIMALEDDGYHTPLRADLFDITSGNHKTIPLPREIGGSSMTGLEHFNGLKLMGAQADRAFLLFGSGYLSSIDFANGTFSPGYYISRSDFSLRVLNNSKVIVAGGHAGSHMLLSRVANCDSCPESYLEYGSVLALSTYEIFDPVAQKIVTSAPSTAFGGPLTIFVDGRVAKLGTITELAKHAVDANLTIAKTRKLLEVSNVAGTSWHTLNLPLPLQSIKSNGGERLLSVKSSEGFLNSVLLIGMPNGAGKLDWWWIDLNGTTQDWQQLGAPQARSELKTDIVALGQLKIADHTFTLIEGDDRFTAMAQ